MPVARGASPWTEERLVQLADHVLAGRSARQIAQAMGMTRSAIIGKAHRLGLPLANKHGEGGGPNPEARRERHLKLRRERHARLLAERGHVYKPKPAKPAPLPPPTPVGALDLLDLGPRQCHWPVTDNAPFFFCGNATDGHDYCPFHAARAIDQNQERRRARLWVF